MSIEQNKQIALRFAQDGWGTMTNWERVWDELVSQDVIYYFNSSPEPIIGLEANKEFNSSLFQGFPNIKQTIEDVVAEGDKVMYRSTIKGTHTGYFLDIPPTGKSTQLNDFTLLQITNAQISQWWYECNLLELMQQLGLMPNAVK
ncbi:MAG: ester cyclase [Cyanobacteria bacterium P01_E01_bin.35]